MAGFRQQLDKEIERRQLGTSETDDQLPPHPKESQKKISLRTFSLGLFLSFTVLSTLMFWAFMNSDETNKDLKERLGSKTVLIEKPAIKEAQTIIPEIEVAPVVAIPPTDNVSKKLPQNNTAPQKSGSLVSAPIPGLFESIDVGLLPKIRDKDGITPFNAYKKPFTASPDKPLLSFVIYNAGLSSQRTAELIELFPAEITFSFSPYSSDLQNIIAVARADGHEPWLSLPLEPKNYPLKDPGPLTLLKSVSEKQNQDRLYKILSSATGYAGLVTNKNHAFDPEAIKTSPVLNEIFTRGLTITDTNLSSPHFNKVMAAKYDAPYGIADIWMDDDLTPIGLNRQIRRMIELGTAKGRLVVMLNNYPTSLNALNKFLSSAAANDFQLAPLSAQVQYVE